MSYHAHHSNILRLMSPIASLSGFEDSEKEFRMRSANTSACQPGGVYAWASPRSEAQSNSKA